MDAPLSAKPLTPLDDYPASAGLPTIARARRRHLPWAQWAVSGFVLAALAVVAIPATDEASLAAARKKALAQAKQIGLALKLFAGDNDGVYPQDGVPLPLHAPITSNAAFAVIFPSYTQSEKIFGNPLSAYQTHVPDDVIDNPYTGTPVNTLAPGENVYAYAMGLKDSSDPATPLVVDGTDGTGHYVSDPARRGGTWSGEAAILIRLDLSGRFEKLDGPPDARYVPLGGSSLSEKYTGKPDDNLLDVSRFGSSVRLLEPGFIKSK